MKGNPNDTADGIFLNKYSWIGAKGYKNYWFNIGDGKILWLGSSGIFLYVDRNKDLIIAKYSSFVQGQGTEEFQEALAILNEIAAGN